MYLSARSFTVYTVTLPAHLRNPMLVSADSVKSLSNKNRKNTGHLNKGMKSFLPILISDSALHVPRRIGI